jgi:hypothetical protein
VPFDVTFLNSFLVLQITVVDYIGRSELDRAQYFALRVLPFLSILIDQVTTSKPYPPFYKSYIGAIVFFQFLYFFIVDWPRSFNSPFSDAAEAFETLNSEKADVKKVIIENNQRSLKMIVYRQMRDGGIQGILMNFFIDEETGIIANEFLRIHEREDGEIEFVKVEQGIRPIGDKKEVEKVFKNLFLKME